MTEPSNNSLSTAPAPNTPVLWLVMDGRARRDPEEARVMSALGQGTFGNVPRKKAKRDFRGTDYCICYGIICGPQQFRDITYLEDVGD